MEIPLSLIISVVCLVWLTVSTIRKNNRQALPQTPATPALPAATSPEHTLVKAWDNQSYNIPFADRGWWYHCSCGLKRVASDLSSTYTGSEAGAIRAWKKHSALYAELSHETAATESLSAIKAEREYIEKYRELCYCKSANDDLILLEQTRPKSLDA